MVRFIDFSRKNFLGILVTGFLFVSLIAVSLSIGKIGEFRSQTQAATGIVDAVVSASANDALQDPPSRSGQVLVAYSFISLYSNDHWGGLRFRIPNIQRGSKINKAYLQVYIDSAGESYPNDDFYLENANNASPFTTTSYSISKRARTKAKSRWYSAIAIGAGWKQSPSVVAPLQEVINRSGWAPGNYIAFVIDSLSSKSFEIRQWDNTDGGRYSKGTFAAKLHIEYSYTPPPPTVDIKANGSDGPITIGYNTAATVRWNSNNATSCSVSPAGWGGTSNGGISTGNLTYSRTYSITCSGAGGSASNSVQVNVVSRPSSSGSSKLNKINLKIIVPFLLGDLKVNVLADQSNNSLVLTKKGTNYKIDVSRLGLSLNKTYTIVISGEKILKRKVQANATSSEVPVDAGQLNLGDLNQDNKINNSDQLSLLDSLSKQTSKGDLNSDGATNSLDWSILVYNIGKRGDK
ncbi:MAG: hypothetical protein A2172_02090 [Candidatus Woykebacteria bacterium RBG_13_40_15]|uniref:Dockerin domain-containing protein n=1 Tax=Candidatus Woykebacteria bacterium RBG_13_40_15 TaxID=1802593 RepID=A0A1G1W726_9BACT|nr:MAG: hypothetical protein A2172_02090 [Candidatus Woykebacteria bacterium RBG_13_40_15]